MPQESNSSAGAHTFSLPRLCRYFSELSPQPMLAVEGADHVVRHANDAFVRLAGKDASELIGRNFADAVPEGEANGCLALLDRVYSTGTAEMLAEQEHRQTPRAFWSYSIWAILGEDERPAGVMVQVTDSTEAALFREQVTAMNQSLLLSSLKHHELAERAEQLNAALHEQSAELADQDRRKDEFLAMLSHELRNPLAALVNAAFILSLEKSETSLQRDARAIIDRQLGQLTRLVEDLLEISRITTGQIRIRPERVVVSGILESAAQTARPMIEQHAHTLDISLPTGPVWIVADAARLEQIVVNLLANAAKYTADGGQIWLSAEQEGAEAVIRVRDTGIGIPPDLLPRIFDLFTQADRTLDRSQGGLGIGLALVQRLVELQQGRVEALSAIGQGSEFIVRLPIAPDAEAAPLASADPDARTSVANLRVLVVDDSLDTAHTTATLLNVAGHETRLAHDGPAALKAAFDYQPDVVILDIGLPGMDGYEVAQRIRQHPGLEKVALIAMTGYGQPADFARSRAAGFDEHFVKPVPLAKLSEAMAAMKARPR